MRDYYEVRNYYEDIIRAIEELRKQYKNAEKAYADWKEKAEKCLEENGGINMKIYHLEVEFNDDSIIYDRCEGYDYGTLFEQFFSNRDSALKALPEVFEQFKIANEEDKRKACCDIRNFKKDDDSISWECGRFSYYAYITETNVNDTLGEINWNF